VRPNILSCATLDRDYALEGAEAFETRQVCGKPPDCGPAACWFHGITTLKCFKRSNSSAAGEDCIAMPLSVAEIGYYGTDSAALPQYTAQQDNSKRGSFERQDWVQFTA
jgi:hypothetical protein